MGIGAEVGEHRLDRRSLVLPERLPSGHRGPECEMREVAQRRGESRFVDERGDIFID